MQLLLFDFFMNIYVLISQQKQYILLKQEGHPSEKPLYNQA